MQKSGNKSQTIIMSERDRETERWDGTESERTRLGAKTVGDNVNDYLSQCIRYLWCKIGTILFGEFLTPNLSILILIIAYFSTCISAQLQT